MLLLRLIEVVFVSLLISTGLAKASGTTTSITSTRRTTSSTTTIPTSSSSTSSTTSDEDLRLLFTVSGNSSYYNINAEVGGQEVGLRLDIVQPDVWVMDNNSFFSCDDIYEFFSSEFDVYSASSSYPSSVTAQPEYYATACASYGVYASDTAAAEPSNSEIFNGQDHTIPYVDTIEAEGVIWTDNFVINSTSDFSLALENFTFINAHSTNMFIGGLGVSGNPGGSGFLSSLMEQGFIKSPGYSLWFSNSSAGNPVAELIPGAVDNSLIDGDLYVYDTLNHSGWRFNNNDQANYDLSNLVLPLLSLQDVYIENEKTGKTMTMLSEGPLPVLLDSRSTYTYLPLDTIVNLAVQSGAIYVSELESWLVECDKITNSSATLNFNFTEVSVKISINEFLSEYDYLTFSNGAKACVLRFLPQDFMGFSSLGLPFLNAIYLAMDNEGKKIAIGNTKNKVAYESDYTSENSVTLSHSTLESKNGSNNTFEYITSGYIPFATTVSSASYPTLTYTALNESSAIELGIPSKLSASIRSSKIYTNNGDPPTPTGTFVSAANAPSSTMTRNAAVGLKPPIRIDLNINGVFGFGYGFILSVLIICISML